jgi:hypothetical protein
MEYQPVDQGKRPTAKDQIEAEIEALRNELRGLERALRVLASDYTEVAMPSGRAPRGNVKNALLDLLEEVGPTGLNATTAVQLARRKQLSLDRNTVSSLLSRFKRDGVVMHDGYRYRLKHKDACLQGA